MSEPEKQSTGAVVSTKAVKFTHEILPSFATVHADGAWLTMNGEQFIQLNFYSEQPAIPQYFILPVGPDGAYTGEQKFAPDDSQMSYITRQVHTGMVLSPRAAIQIRDALTNFINMTQPQPVANK